MAWAHSQNFPDCQTKLLLLVLANYANQSGCCWPSIESLEEECLISRNTVRDRLKTLCELKLLSMTSRLDAFGRGETYEFEVLFPRGHAVKGRGHGVTGEGSNDPPERGQMTPQKGSRGDPDPIDPVDPPDNTRAREMVERLDDFANPGNAMAAFEKFWAVYPKKLNRQDAERAFFEVGGAGCIDEILAAVDSQSRSQEWRREQGRFVPRPSNWLRDRRWTDENNPISEETQKTQSLVNYIQRRYA